MKRILALFLALMLFCSSFSVFAQGTDGTDSTQTDEETIVQEETTLEAVTGAEPEEIKNSEVVMPEFSADVNDTETIQVEETQTQDLREGDNPLTAPMSGTEYVFMPERDGEYTFTVDEESYISYFDFLDASKNSITTNRINTYQLKAALKGGETYYLSCRWSFSSDINLNILWDVYPLSEDGYLYATNSDGTVNIIGYQGEATQLVVPVAVTNATTKTSYNVKSVNRLVGSKNNITSVKISGGIQSVDSNCFDNSSRDVHLSTIQSIEIPESITIDYLYLRNLAIQDLSGIQAEITWTINLSNCSSLRDISALKDIISSQGNIMIYSCPAISKIAVPETFSSLSIDGFSGTNLDFLNDCSQLKSLTVKGQNLTDISGLQNVEGMTTLSLFGCSNLSDVGILKGKNIATINLSQTAVPRQDAYDLIEIPEKVSLTYVHDSESFSMTTKVVLSDNLYRTDYDSNYDIQIEDTDIATVTKGYSAWDIQADTQYEGVRTTIGHIMYGSEDTGKSFVISYDGSKPNPEQPLDSGNTNLKESFSVSVPNNDWQIWGLFEDDTLWKIGSKGNNESEKMLDNVKSYVGEYSYYRISSTYAPNSELGPLWKKMTELLLQLSISRGGHIKFKTGLKMLSNTKPAITVSM